MNWWQTLCASTVLSFLQAAPVKLSGKQIALLISIRDGIDTLLGKQA